MNHEMISKSFKSKEGATSWPLHEGIHIWCRAHSAGTAGLSPAGTDAFQLHRKAWMPGRAQRAPGMAWIIWNPTSYNTINTIWLMRIAKFRQPQVVCEPSKPQLGAEMSCFHDTFDLCLRVQGLWLEEYCMSFKGQHSTGWSKHLQQQWKKQPVSSFNMFQP